MKHPLFYCCLLLAVTVVNVMKSEGASWKDTLHHQFQIVRNGKKVGTVEASMLNGIYEKKLILKSKISGQFILKINIYNYCENILMDGCLKSSFISRKVNGTESIQHAVERKDGLYYSIGKDKIKGQLPSKIYFTTVLMYFKEPVGIREVYSEPQRRMVPVQKIGNASYRIEQTPTVYSDFFYEHGILKKVSSKTSYGEVFIVKN